MKKSIVLNDLNPFIRYINDYIPTTSYVEHERIIYDFELMYVVDGSVTMTYANVIYELKKDDLFLLSPFVKNSITVRKENNFRTHCIHFDFIKIDEKYDFTAEDAYIDCCLTKDLSDRPAPCPVEFTDIKKLPSPIIPDNLYSLFDTAYTLFLQHDLPSSIQLKGIMLEIFACMLRRNSPEMYSMIHPKIKPAIRWINTNYSNQITVVELARKFNLSPKYFGNLFIKSTGMNVSTYVLNLRIKNAKHLLRSSDASLLDIAENTGFSNQFYFSKCFHEQEGCTPSQFRKRFLHVQENKSN